MDSIVSSKDSRLRIAVVTDTLVNGVPVDTTEDLEYIRTVLQTNPELRYTGRRLTRVSGPSWSLWYEGPLLLGTPGTDFVRFEYTSSRLNVHKWSMIELAHASERRVYAHHHLLWAEAMAARPWHIHLHGESMSTSILQVEPVTAEEAGVFRQRWLRSLSLAPYEVIS